MVVAGRASDLNSLPSSDKVFLLPREQIHDPVQGSRLHDPSQGCGVEAEGEMHRNYQLGSGKMSHRFSFWNSIIAHVKGERSPLTIFNRMNNIR